MPTKTSQKAYKNNNVGKRSQQNDFVPVLYPFCRQVKIFKINKLQKNAYKTTKIGYFGSAFFPLQQIQRRIQILKNI